MEFTDSLLQQDRSCFQALTDEGKLIAKLALQSSVDATDTSCRTFPSIQKLTPPWDLNLVLSVLIKPPLQPLASSFLSFLSMKVAFLVAITSARKVGELGAMVPDPSYTIFHNDKVSVCLHPKFTLKVVSEFHLNQSIHLPMFFPKEEERRLCSLDVRQAFYLQRTKPVRKSQRLFVAIAERIRGHSVPT